MRQFNLELTLVSLGPQGENIQNQSRPVDHPTAYYFLKIALLKGSPSRGANTGHDAAAGRLRQTSQFVKVSVNDTAVKALMYEDSTFRLIEMR